MTLLRSCLAFVAAVLLADVIRGVSAQSDSLLGSIYGPSPPSYPPGVVLQGLDLQAPHPPPPVPAGLAGLAGTGFGTGVGGPSPPPPAATVLPVGFADLDTKLKEKAALLALRKSLNNHPVFDLANWVEVAPGLTYNTTFPCLYTYNRPVLTCQNDYVVGIDLSNPTLINLNVNWTKGSSPGALSGNIPWKALSSLKYLSFLALMQNDIEGPNFEGVSGLTALTRLDMQLNSLTGTIHTDVGGMKSLQTLTLYANHMTGSLPDVLGQLSELTFLDLSSNNFNGTLPSGLADITKLRSLFLGLNKLYGSLPPSYGNLSNLESLVLQNNAFKGPIPSSWSAMRSLEHIDVSQNSLQDVFPSYWLTTSNLSFIDISSNQFYGLLPSNLFSSKGSNITTVDASGNCFNGTKPINSSPLKTFKDQSNCFNHTNYCATRCAMLYPAPPSSKSDDTSALLAGVISAVSVLLLFALLLCLYRRRSKKASFSKALKQAVREFSLTELKKATRSWALLLGKGGYGSVYKAVLRDGSIVAVKRLDQVSKQGDMEFVREVELLSRVHHRHLVNLVGFCAEQGERVLVYEYMAMGSLYEHLHGASSKEFPLSWDSRTKIAIHIALGIEYLHYGADPPLIHRDVKSANILLSDDGYSKVADFGLCKEAPLGADGAGGEALQPTATAVRGSFGYLDPEYVNTSVLSEKSDVYSYGVVLLELITGHKSIHEWQPLAYWAEEYLSDREKTPLMVDPALEGSFDVDELYALCEIARTCVQDQAVLRPTIRDVAKALVENLGHLGSSYGTSSVGGDSQSLMSATDTSSLTGTSYTAADTASGAPSQSFTYQNYSETLHWEKSGSGKMSTTSSRSTSMSTGIHGNRLPVPVPAPPPQKKDSSDGSV